MDRITLAAATGMGLVFATGVIAGIVLMVAMAIRKQDRPPARRADRAHPNRSDGTALASPSAAHTSSLRSAHKAGKDQTP